MYILGLLLKTKQGSQFLVVMTDRYIKLAKAVTTTKRNTTTAARVSLKDWLAKYLTPSKVLTKNGP